MNSQDTNVQQKNTSREKLIQNQYKIGEGGVIEWTGKVGRLFNIEMNKLFKTPMLLFGIFGLPMILLFGIGALVQDGALLSPCFGMEAIVVAGIIFGDLYYTMEKSTLEKSTSTANYGHKTKLFTIALVTTVVTFVAIMFMLVVFIICEVADFFFMPGFVFFGDAHYQSLTIEWLNLPWLDLFYYIIFNILLTIALLILVKNFFASNKTFTMFILTYVLMDIMFGGVLIMNYNAAEVIINSEGQLEATGYLANQDVLLGTKDSVWDWNSWYSYVKFFIPHYFLNQQFATLLKVGSEQQAGAYWFDANGIYHVNWSVATIINDASLEDINANGVNDDFEWMLDAQYIITTGSKAPEVGATYNAEFTIVGQGYDVNNIYTAYYTFNKALPQNASFWSAYNGDYTFTMSIVLPYVYTIGLTWLGFGLSRATRD